MKINKNPPQEFLRKNFLYDEEGWLVWIERQISHWGNHPKAKALCNSWNSRFAGKRAGAIDKKGYFQIGILFEGDYKSFKLHRLIYSWHFGNIPDGMQVDHEDTNKSNNKVSNLRLATHGENRSNASLNKNSTSGVKGVSQSRGRWQARVQKNNVREFRYFGSKEEAEIWVREFRAGTHKEFANHGTHRSGLAKSGGDLGENSAKDTSGTLVVASHTVGG